MMLCRRDLITTELYNPLLLTLFSFSRIVSLGHPAISYAYKHVVVCVDKNFTIYQMCIRGGPGRARLLDVLLLPRAGIALLLWHDAPACVMMQVPNLGHHGTAAHTPRAHAPLVSRLSRISPTSDQGKYRSPGNHGWFLSAMVSRHTWCLAVFLF